MAVDAGSRDGMDFGLSITGNSAGLLVKCRFPNGKTEGMLDVYEGLSVSESEGVVLRELTVTFVLEGFLISVILCGILSAVVIILTDVILTWFIYDSTGGRDASATLV